MMMTRSRIAWIVTLILALAALGSSVAWAATRSDGDGGRMGHGSGMMGFSARDGGAPVADLAQARTRAEAFAGRLDLKVGEAMQFSNGFYAELTEQNGRLATEVLIDPRTGATWFEYGPAMMWNTRFGMMGGGGSTAGMGGAMTEWMMGGSGMMGGGSPADRTWTPGSVTGGTQIDASEAQRLAQRWLDANRAGRQAAEAETFPGYYTLHVERGGRIEGMLSVNASRGAVWYHGWHGRFVAMDG
jgi:hypothetical protein